MKIYVLAQNQKEAEDLYRHGCGYGTRAAAQKAKDSPEIDSYYRNLMKIFEIEESPPREEAQ
jgi:hypothetical protein